MQVTTERPDPCTVVLDITVEAEKVARAFDRSYREFSKHTNIPGFRPGKAPRAIVERFVNHERVKEATVEQIVRDVYPEALQQAEVEPFRQPRIDPSELADKSEFHFKVIIPLEPQVTLKQYTGLTVEKPVYSFSEEALDRAIEDLRKENARLERVTDRGVEPGDILIAEMMVTVEGEEPTGEPRRQLIQLGNNIPGFDDAIIGMQLDTEKVFDLTYPEDYEEEEKRGKGAHYRVTIKGISARKLPELNEEFAKLIAGVDTVEALRDVVRRRNEAELLTFSDQIAESRLIEGILNEAEIHFPDVLVSEELEQDFRRLAGELHRRNMTYEMFLAQSGQTAEQHHAVASQEARVRVARVLALRVVAEQQNLNVDDEAIDQKLAELRAVGALTEEQLDEYTQDKARRYRLADAIVQDRLHEYLFANNTINEVAKEGAPGEEEVTQAAEAAEAAAKEIANATPDSEAEQPVASADDNANMMPDAE